MKNKILISTLLFALCTAFLCSYSFANNMMQSAGNTIRNAGNAVGNAAAQTGNTIVNGTRNLINGATDMGDDAMNGAENMMANYDNTTSAIYDTNNDDYTAQRTAAGNTGLFGMSDTMTTWLILGIVGAVIVGLIWYYGAQYEHRNYNND